MKHSAAQHRRVLQAMHAAPQACVVGACRRLLVSTLLTILRARAAKPSVLSVSCRQASEGLTLAMMTVLALPPIESCTHIMTSIASSGVLKSSLHSCIMLLSMSADGVSRHREQARCRQLMALCVPKPLRPTCSRKVSLLLR